MERKKEMPKIPLTEKPCPRCLEAAAEGIIHGQAVQRLPEGAFAPLADDGSGKCCHDCASADTIVRLKILPRWGMARTAVGNDRMEQYRLPGVPMGLVKERLVRPSQEGDFEDQLEWLEREGLWGGEMGVPL
jgi:hypothetical protein